MSFAGTIPQMMLNSFRFLSSLLSRVAAMASATAGAIFVFVPLPSPLPSIAHMLKNVSFFLHNVKRPDRGNRRRNAVATGENTMRRHSLGDRFSCKRYRNFCKRYCEGPTAASATGRRGRFSASERRIFRGFNERLRRSHRKRFILSKTYGVMLALFSVAGAGGGFRGNFRGQ